MLTSSELTSSEEVETYYTPQEVAARCGLSRRRIYDWLSCGWLRGRRLGGRWVVMAEDWDFFSRTCRGAGGRLMPSLRDWEAIWNARPEPALANGVGETG